jgi:hypothetical protein
LVGEATRSSVDWYLKQVEKEARKDVLAKSDLFGQVVGMVCICVFLAFFVIHQTRPTGFFTSDFGNVEAALFYGAGAYGLIPSAVRLITGRKNPARFFDGIGSGLMLVSVTYLLAVFPFDFSYVAEPLPGFMQFLLDWVSNDLAKIVMVIAAIATAATTPYTLMLYYGVRSRLRLAPEKVEPEEPAEEEIEKEDIELEEVE